MAAKANVFVLALLMLLTKASFAQEQIISHTDWFINRSEKFEDKIIYRRYSFPFKESIPNTVLFTCPKNNNAYKHIHFEMKSIRDTSTDFKSKFENIEVRFLVDNSSALSLKGELINSEMFFDDEPNNHTDFMRVLNSRDLTLKFGIYDATLKIRFANELNASFSELLAKNSSNLFESVTTEKMLSECSTYRISSIEQHNDKETPVLNRSGKLGIACNYETASNIASLEKQNAQKSALAMIDSEKCEIFAFDNNLKFENTKSNDVFYLTRNGKHVGFSPKNLLASGITAEDLLDYKVNSTKPYYNKAVENKKDLEKFAVGEIYGGPMRMPDFMGRDKNFRLYRTRIREGIINNGLNFGGQYSIIGIGCGTQCQLFAVVNLFNGRATWFPAGGENYPAIGLDYAYNSRSVIATWIRENRCIRSVFVWDGNRFINGLERDIGDESVCYH